MRSKAVWRSFVTLVLTALLFFLSAFCSFAWFSKNLISGRFGFSVGALDDNLLHVALITRTSADVEPTEDMRQYHPCEGGRFLAERYPTPNGDAYAVELSDLSFGIIDNVARLKAENRVFLRLSVPKDSGDTVEVKLCYGAYSDGNFAELYKNVYDAEGETVLYQERIEAGDTLEDGTPILESFLSVEGEEMADDCYLSFSVLMSNEEIAADKLCEATFYGADGEPAMNGDGSFYRVNAFDGDSAGIMLKNEDIETADDYYYVYVCIEPNLAVFGHSIEYISGIMPCYVFFKVNAVFTVYRGV